MVFFSQIRKSKTFYLHLYLLPYDLIMSILSPGFYLLYWLMVPNSIFTLSPNSHRLQQSVNETQFECEPLNEKSVINHYERMSWIYYLKQMNFLWITLEVTVLKFNKYNITWQFCILTLNLFHSHKFSNLNVNLVFE